MSITDAVISLGVPVFPIRVVKQQDGTWDKYPAIGGGHGHIDAASDPADIRRIFGSVKANGAGMPTGTVSGICVIDVDTKKGRDGRKWLEENQEALPQTHTVRTPSDGLHLYFIMPDGFDIRNSTGRVAPGVDVRGNGGWVAIPPSPGYRVADATPPAEMPRWLIKACLKKEPTSEPSVAHNGVRHERYVQAAIDGEIGALVRAPEGTRNDTLIRSAFSLGTLIAAGQIERSTAEAELLQACSHWDKRNRRKDADTIKRGLDAGMIHPRKMPERDKRDKTGQDAQHADKMDEAQTDGPPLPLVWFDEIQASLDAKDFVEGVLIEKSAAVVYGESNAGKTFWTTDLSLHVAAGLPWNGRHVDQGGVIYCVLEGGFGFQNRVTAWKKSYGFEGKKIPFASIPATLNLLNPDADVGRLIETIKYAASLIAVPVKLVVIDTLARAMSGGNENSSEDMGALVMNTDRIRTETGACVIFIHHSGKDQAKGARGHSSLRAAVDTEIEVVASEDEEKSATIAKQRDLQKGDVFGFKLTVIELGKNTREKPVTSCVVTHGEPGQGGQTGKQKRRRLTPNGALALRAFNISMSRCGALLPALGDYPPNTVATPHSEWRQEFYQLKGGSADTNKHAFSRGETELLAENVITARNGLVWFVRSKGEQS